jgi:hypothetical protein
LLPFKNSDVTQVTGNTTRPSVTQLKKGESDATVIDELSHYSIIGPIIGGILGVGYIALFFIDKYYLLDVFGLDIFMLVMFVLMLFFQFGFGILNSHHSRQTRYSIWAGVALAVDICIIGVFAGVFALDFLLGYFFLIPATALVLLSTRVKYTKIGVERIANRESWKVYDTAHIQEAGGNGLIPTSNLLRDYNSLTVWMFIKTFCCIVFISTPAFAIIGFPII